MKFFNRDGNKEEISRTEPGYEEGERHTPWTGVILLVIMVIAGISFGWRALDDLARVPTEPTSLSHCASRYFDGNNYVASSIVSSPLDYPSYYDKYYYSGVEEPACEWNNLEKEAGIPALEDQRRPLVKSLNDITQKDTQDLAVARDRRQQLEAEYDIRLQEQQAGVQSQAIPTLAQLQQQINQARQDEERLRAAVAANTVKTRATQDQIDALDEQIKTAYAPVFTAQNRLLRFYEFKVFLLQLLFVLPLFYFALRSYLKQLKKNSPYAIILTGVVGVMGVLLFRIIMVWFWDLFLAHLIEVLWNLIKSVEILRSIVFYLGMVLSFVIFGGAVYYLQKKIFDPRRLAIRRFRAKQCPQCQTSLDLSQDFCPQCGHHIRENCPTCGKPRFIELPFCPHCGTKKS